MRRSGADEVEGAGHAAPKASPHDDAETSELAIASLFLSIIWLFGLGSVAGMYLGVRSLREIREADGALGGRVLAIAGVVVGVVGMGSLALVIVFATSFN